MFETIVFAEGEAVTNTAAAGGTAALLSTLLPLVFVFILMYVIMIRPQKKKEKALRDQINQMKIGDKIVTIGGIVGKVAKIKDDYVIMETGNLGTQDQKSTIKMEKSSIREVSSKESN